jgi:hypothetical protein
MIDRTSMSDDLRGMPTRLRAETIVDIFRTLAGEFAAMVLEHVDAEHPRSTVLDPPEFDDRRPFLLRAVLHRRDADDDPIRERLQGLPLDVRCQAIGHLFAEVCTEFAALVDDQGKPTGRQ